MIYLTKNQSNTVVLTLNEKATTTTYDVLFEFTNDMKGEGSKILFTADDTSITPFRFNQFTIEETTSENYYQGKVELIEGTWTYKVYEMPSASPKSLDVDASVGVLEVGKVTVEVSADVNYLGNDTKNNKIFE